MVIWRGDVEPLGGAPGWIGDEVGERLVEWPNGLIGIFLKDKEGVDR